jgi:hypothetical protein
MKASTRIILIVLSGMMAYLVMQADVGPIFGVINKRSISLYSEKFQGSPSINTHALFDPKHADKKKILFLGPSFVMSIGCDMSWSFPDKTRNPERNEHQHCTIHHQLQLLLEKGEYNKWRTFNLASNASKFAHSFFIYLATLKIKPDIVIIGGNNYNYLTRFGLHDPYFIKSPIRLKFIKQSLKTLLGDKAWQPWEDYLKTWAELSQQKNLDAIPYYDFAPDPVIPIASYSLVELVQKRFSEFRKTPAYEGPLLPVKHYPWTMEKSSDSGEGYQHGYLTSWLKQIKLIQQQHGGNLLYYQHPTWGFRDSPTYQKYFSQPLTKALDEAGVINRNWVDFPLKIVEETYDGGHQTLQGNQRIAQLIFDALQEEKLLGQKHGGQ